jgi:hypothetical protein
MGGVGDRLIGGPDALMVGNQIAVAKRLYPNTRAITLIGNPSPRCSRRISAQSSTDNIPFWSSWLG